jgi:hypothetical protein
MVYDISGADLVISCRGAGHLGRECAALAAGPLSGGLPTLRDDGPVAAVVIERRVYPCCRGERSDPGRGTDCGAAARGSTTAPGCRGGDRASRAAELGTSGIVPLEAGAERGSSSNGEAGVHLGDCGPDGCGALPFALAEQLTRLLGEFLGPPIVCRPSHRRLPYLYAVTSRRGKYLTEIEAT